MTIRLALTHTVFTCVWNDPHVLHILTQPIPHQFPKVDAIVISILQMSLGHGDAKELAQVIETGRGRAGV